MAAKLRKGDKVIVLSGKDKGKTGTISSVDPKSNKAIVDGVKIAIRATRHKIKIRHKVRATCHKQYNKLCTYIHT